jgi:RNA polymerase sigma-70 factor (ECF subfamily)
MTSRVGSVDSVREASALNWGRGEGSISRSQEGDLIRKAANGDKDAYRHIVERHQRRLFLSAFEVLRNREDAEDVVQEALARSFFSLKSFRGGSSLSTWLQRIVFNLAIDLKRRVRRRGGEPVIFEEGITVAADSAFEGGGSDNPEALLRQKEHRERMMRVLDDLSDEHRQTIILREFEGLSYDEIARATGVSSGTVMSRLFYARKKLQSALAEMRS